VYYFTVRFDIPRDDGVEERFREFLERAKKFWLAQPGVREFKVYGDTLINWPERVIMIGVNDRESLQRILDSEARRAIRQEMLGFVKHPSWQLLELKEFGSVSEHIEIAEPQAAGAN
jgi:hypothetical protein